jgi:hypothetical protein
MSLSWSEEEVLVTDFDPGVAAAVVFPFRAGAPSVDIVPLSLP